MNRDGALVALRRARKTVSFALLFKSVVGTSIAALTLFGVAVPHFGIEPTFASGGAAAGLGALIGGALALKA